MHYIELKSFGLSEQGVKLIQTISLDGLILVLYQMNELSSLNRLHFT